MVSRQHPSSFSSSFLLSLIFCLLEDCVKKCEQLCRVTWQSEVNGYLTRACACVCAAAHSGEWALTDMGLCRAYFWNHAAKRRAFRRINWTFFRLHLPQRFISGKLEPLIRPFRPLIDLVPCPHHLHVLCYTCIESQQLLIYFRDSPPLCLHYTNADIPISDKGHPSPPHCQHRAPYTLLSLQEKTIISWTADSFSIPGPYTCTKMYLPHVHNRYMQLHSFPPISPSSRLPTTVNLSVKGYERGWWLYAGIINVYICSSRLSSK